MHSSLSALLLLALTSSAVAQNTTVPAYFAPPRVAASVITLNPTATTFTVQCTTQCTGTDAVKGTIVNGPSTAGFTQIWTETDKTQKTLIYDCSVASSSVGNCVVKAVSDGTSGGSFTTTSTFKSGAVVVTGGLEQLGYVLATTTAEVNTTVTVKKTSGTTTATAGVDTTTSASDSSATTTNISGTATRTSARTATAAGAAASSSSSAAAATLAAERVGGAVIGLAGLLLAAM